MKFRNFLRSGWAIAPAGILGFAIKLLLARKTYGTNDVYSYQQFAFWSRYLGVDLYHIDPLFNHPPSMIHVLQFMDWLSRTTGFSFSFWLRLPAILADAANLWLVWKLLGERVRERSIFLALLLLAVAPTLILVSGFHGNTDSLVMFFVLLSVYLIEKDASVWAAGAALGLAHCVKIYPLIAAPAIVLNLLGWPRRIRFCAAAGAVVLIGWSPFLFQDPHAVLGQVFGYRSAYGMWGIAYILDQLAAMAPRVTPVNAAFQHFGAYLALGLVLLASWKLSRAKPRPQLFSQVGFAFLLFLTISSGFGVQYLAWMAPWVVEQGWLAAALFYATSGVFLFQVYNLWAEGLPWYLANSYNLGTFVGYCDYAQLICWISLLVVLWLAAKRLFPMPSVALRWRWAAAAAAAALIWAVVPRQLPAPEPTGNKYEPAVRSINAHSYLDLAAVLSDRGRYRESIEAAHSAVALTEEVAADAAAIIASDQAALGAQAH